MLGDHFLQVKNGINASNHRQYPAGKELEDDYFFREYVKRVLQMDHSIFGNLMDINGDFKEESHYPQDEIYLGERGSSAHIPEGSVEYGYNSDFYPLTVHIDITTPQNEVINATKKKITEASIKKNIKRRNKKKLSVKGKELRFSCSLCDYRTWKKSNFQRHLGTHNKKTHKCSLCAYSSKYADDLKKHMLRHTKKESLHMIDEKRFATLKDEVTIEPRWTYPVVSNSREVKHQVKEESQLYCPPLEVYLDEQSSNSCLLDSSGEEGYPLAVHVDIASPQDSQKLQLNSSQVSVNNDREALLKNSRELRYSCPYCSYRTWKTSNFQRHLCTHTNERPHKCALCKYSGKHHEDLKKHMLCHNKRGSAIVPRNGKLPANFEIKLRQETSLPVDRKSPENKLNQEPTEPMDDEPADYIENNLEQESSLNSTKRFACQLCDFKSTRSSMLYRHQRVVHNDNRPFACDLCPYRSKQRDSLKKHMMAHTDERPFECEICHHKCRQKGDLKRHKLLHSGERPFACPHCSYRSNRCVMARF